MMIVLHFPWRKMILLLPGLLLAFRFGNFANIITNIYSSESQISGYLIISIASLMLFLGSVTIFILSMKSIKQRGISLSNDIQ